MGLLFTESSLLSPTILCFFILITTSSSASSESHNSLDNNKPTAYDILSDYSFPIGILPKGVIGYDLDSSTGKFSAYLNDSCSFFLEGSYQLNYQSTIKGYLSNGKLSSLEGVSVKVFFMWVEITEVSRRGNDVEFSVGIAGAYFPIDNFKECPQCGCGLKCNDRKVSKFRTNPFVSSY